MSYNLRREYTVVFVVKGHLDDPDDSIGMLECNGTIENESHQFEIKDGRAYYHVTANTPEEAYLIAKDIFENDAFGNLIIDETCLEHVELDNDTWYIEDLHLN